MSVCVYVCVRRVGQKNRTVSPISLGTGSPHFGEEGECGPN